jgi:hypothetical protein
MIPKNRLENGPGDRQSFLGYPMEKFEERIIDLVDVISEPDSDRPREPHTAPMAAPSKESPMEMETGELEFLVRNEVERLIKSTVEEKVDKMIREILVQEVEKAIAREMEKLKRV